jgi:hypothetical protein
VWSQTCNYDVCPPDCLGGDAVIKGVSHGKIVVDEVIGGKVVKKQFWSEKQVRGKIRRAQDNCDPNDSTAQKWRGELSKQLKALEKNQKK